MRYPIPTHLRVEPPFLHLPLGLISIPLTVSQLPVAPAAGVNPVISGGRKGVTWNTAELCTVPAAVVTETLPLVALGGTVAVRSVSELNV